MEIINRGLKETIKYIMHHRNDTGLSCLASYPCLKMMKIESTKMNVKRPNIEFGI